MSGLCPKGLPFWATILTEARLDALWARLPSPHSPLVAVTGSSFFLLPKSVLACFRLQQQVNKVSLPGLDSGPFIETEGPVGPNKNKFISQSLPAGRGTQHVLAGAQGCPPTPKAQVWVPWNDRILAAQYLETLGGAGR